MAIPARRSVALLLTAAALACVATRAQGQPSPPSSPEVVLVVFDSQRSADTSSVFASLLRAQLTPALRLRVLEESPPAGPQSEKRAWANRIAASQAAGAVLWVEDADPASRAAVMWTFVRADALLQSFTATEEREFDRYRSFALAAGTFLRGLGDSHPSAGRPAGTENELPGFEEDAAEVVSAPENARAAASEPEETIPGADSDAPPSLAEQTSPRGPHAASPRGHVLLGPALGLSGRGPALGFAARAGLWVRARALLRVFLTMNRERTTTTESGARWAQNRFSAGFRTLGALTYGKLGLRAGAGGGIAVSRWSPRQAADGSARRHTVLAPTVGLSCSASVQLARELFLALPLSLDYAVWQRTPSFGGEAAPTVELTVGLSIGFGR